MQTDCKGTPLHIVDVAAFCTLSPASVIQDLLATGAVADK